VRLIRVENKRTQLCLQIELAEVKSQSLQSRWSTTNVPHKRKKITVNVTKKFCMQPEVASKHFDFHKVKPEPGLTRKARPDLQLCDV